jgi:O-acetyl-ADP-ribose deacetylase (regulator of RNase III)
MTSIYIQSGDLTALKVDAIVNAANNDLILGGGLAGAIARAGGPEIQEQCTRHGPVQVGQAAITTGGNLPARYVIHQASMRLGGLTTAKNLRSSTRAVLALAEENGVKTLALPATGTGIAGFDVDLCAEIMIGEVLQHVAGETQLTDVYFVLMGQRALQAFEEAWGRMKGPGR